MDQLFEIKYRDILSLILKYLYINDIAKNISLINKNSANISANYLEKYKKFYLDNKSLNYINTILTAINLEDIDILKYICGKMNDKKIEITSDVKFLEKSIITQNINIYKIILDFTNNKGTYYDIPIDISLNLKKSFNVIPFIETTLDKWFTLHTPHILNYSSKCFIGQLIDENCIDILIKYLKKYDSIIKLDENYYDNVDSLPKKTIEIIENSDLFL